MIPEVMVCELAAIGDGDARGFEIDGPEGRRRLILTRRGRAVQAYLNSCPHTGVRLDWRPGDFMDLSGRYLQCATHGALFEPDTGRCIEGPCAGARLIAAPVRVDASGVVRVQHPSGLPDSAAPRRS